MVPPRMRSSAKGYVIGGGDLSLPHAVGDYDPECKHSKRKMETSLIRLACFRFGKGSEKGLLSYLCGFLVLLVLVKSFLLGGGGDSMWSGGSSYYPWKSMARPANLSKPKVPSTIYTIPGSTKLLGDRTDFYATLRKEFDKRFPSNNRKRTMEAVNSLQKYDIEPFHVLGHVDEKDYYDLSNCPENPPAGYPHTWKIFDILHHWPADETEPKSQIFQSLCVFDYTIDLRKAIRYRDAELPFIIRGDPEVATSVERWNTPYYLEALLGHVSHHTDKSHNNHFMHWDKSEPKPSIDWKAPMQRMDMTYKEWLSRANVTQDKLEPEMPHWYLRLTACREGRHCSSNPQDYLFDELPFFKPKHNSLYVKEANSQRSIHCHFGMKGVNNQNHFGVERSFVTVLSGEKRFIVSSPDQCSKLALLPIDHPSKRYSHPSLDWSDPDLETHPEFASAMGSEVVLQPGDSIFFPSMWFRHEISLGLTARCNTGGGFNPKHFKDLEECGYKLF